MQPPRQTTTENRARLHAAFWSSEESAALKKCVRHAAKAASDPRALQSTMKTMVHQIDAMGGGLTDSGSNWPRQQQARESGLEVPVALQQQVEAEPLPVPRQVEVWESQGSRALQ